VLHVLVVSPLLSVIEEKAHVLPVDGVSLPILNISDRWDLEWEQSRSLDHRSFVLLFGHTYSSTLIVELEQVVVAQKFAVEATHDYDFVWRKLSHSSSLSGGDGLSYRLSS